MVYPARGFIIKKSLPVAGLALGRVDVSNEIIPLYENVEANVKGAIFGYDQAYYLANFAKQVKERSINCQIYSNNSYLKIEQAAKLNLGIEIEKNLFAFVKR